MKLSCIFLGFVCFFATYFPAYANWELIQNVKNLSYMAVPPSQEEIEAYQQKMYDINSILNNEVLLNLAQQEPRRIEERLIFLEEKFYMNQLENKHAVISELMEIQFILFIMEVYHQETDPLFSGSLLQTKINYLKDKINQLFAKINMDLKEIYGFSPEDIKYVPSQNIKLPSEKNIYTEAALNAFIKNGILKDEIKKIDFEKIDMQLLNNIYRTYLLSLENNE